MSIETQGVLEEKFDEEQGFVCEKSNRFSAAWKFLRENNRRVTNNIHGVDFVVARTFLLMNFPIGYAIAFLNAEYSPQNLGYKF